VGFDQVSPHEILRVLVGDTWKKVKDTNPEGAGELL
jgi:hypothetical protein